MNINLIIAKFLIMRYRLSDVDDNVYYTSRDNRTIYIFCKGGKDPNTVGDLSFNITRNFIEKIKLKIQ